MHAETFFYSFCWFWLFVCCNIPINDSYWLELYHFCWWFCSLVRHSSCFSQYFLFFCMGFLLYKHTIFFFTNRHNKSTVHFHLISSSHHCRVRMIRNFLLLYQRNQQAGWVAASGPIVEGKGAPEVEEVGRGAWWCPAWVDIPYPSGRSPWTLGTVRGRKQGGDYCRPSVPPPSGRTRPQKAPTALRSTSQKPKPDSEHKTEVSPTHLLTYLHPCQADPPTPISVFLWGQFWIFCGSLFILYPSLKNFHHFTNHNYKFTSLAYWKSNDSHFSVFITGTEA